MSYLLGTWQFSQTDWGAQSPTYKNSMESILHYCYEHGVTTLDTAPIYGLGQVESDLGMLSIAKKYAVASKFGLVWQEPYSHKTIEIALTKNGIIRECEATLSRLRREVIDYYFLHYPPHGGLSDSECAAVHDAIDHLQREGKIVSFGLSNCSESTILQMRALHDVSAIQFEFNALKQWALEKLSTTIADPSIEKWVYSPLARGVLGELDKKRLITSPDDHRTRLKWFQGSEYEYINQKLAEVTPLLAEMGISYSQLFINWIRCRFPEFKIIVGSRSLEQIKDTLTTYDITETYLSVIDSLFVRPKVSLD